jgi:NADH:ubiquinone oxidoreductase subunit 4 (subunit M)
MLSIKEWNLDRMMYLGLWQPLKKLGNSLTFISAKMAVSVLLPLSAAGLYLAYHRQVMPKYLVGLMPYLLAAVSLSLTLRAFVKRNRAHNAWMLLVLSQFFVALAIAFNEQFEIWQIVLYLSGIVVSAAIGLFCFRFLEKSGEGTSLDRFHGHAYEHPRLTNLFLIACLGMIGFPITPSFVGEDVILGHVHENQYLLTFLVALNLILDSLVAFRIYARVFLGPHEKTYHEIAYRSS